MEFSAQQIADFLKGEVVGNKDIKVNNFSKIEEGKKGDITFLSNPKYTNFIYTTKADIVLVNKSFTPEHAISATLIKVEDSYQALSQLLTLAEEIKSKKTGISPKADIAASADIGEDVFIGAFVSIGENCKIGKNVKIHSNTQIADNVQIGDNSIIYTNVSIYKDCIIGKDNIIHSGAVIGADGFSFAPEKNGHYRKISPIGNVILGSDVEVGANTTIDRATLGSTTIGDGVKIDNLVQIAHGVEIGEHTAIAAQCGIAGSAKIGKHCVFAGQVGVAGHITIADNSTFGAQTGVAGSIKEPNKIWQGSPMMPVGNFRRSTVGFKQLPDLMQKIYTIEKESKLKN